MLSISTRYLSVIFLSLGINFTYAETALVGNSNIHLEVVQGEAQLSIPIELPSTADGMRPKLSIYSSKGLGNPLLGQGFKFSGFSRVHRCQTNMDDDGRITPLSVKENNFCINGKRLKQNWLNLGKYQRIKNSYSKFSFNIYDQTWKEEAGDGRIYHYMPIGKAGKQRFEWRVSKIESIAAQNSIHYSYDSNSLVTKPTSISYSDYQVDFNYIDAPLAKSGIHGDFYQDNQRLDSINIKKAGSLIKKYKLGYQKIKQQFFLNSLQVCYDNERCLKPAQINYEQDNAFEYAWINKPQAFNKTVDRNSPLKSEIRVLGDVNADGIDDNCTIYIEDRALYCSVNGTSSKWLDFSGAFDIAYIQTLYTGDFDTKVELQKQVHKARIHLGELSSSNLVDINRDGYADFCFTSNNHLYCAINNKNGFNAYQSMQALTPINPNTPLSAPAKIIWQDFNGDGFTDFCAIESHGKRLDGSVNYLTYTSNYKSYYEQTTQTSCYTNQQGRRFYKQNLIHINPITTLLSLPIILSADINGNGRKDLCFITLNAKKTVPINQINQTMSTGSAQSVLSCYSQEGLIGQLDLLQAASSGNTFGDSDEEIKEVNRFSRSVRLVDVSKDGVSDLCFVWKDQPQCIINDGKLSASTHAILKSNISVKPDYGSLSSAMQQIMDSSLSFKDFNSDGEIDACWIDLSGFHCAYGYLGQFLAPTRLFEVPLSDKGIFSIKPSP